MLNPDQARAIARVCALSGLTKRQAEVFLYHCCGLGQPSIAAALGITRPTVAGHLALARERVWQWHYTCTAGQRAEAHTLWNLVRGFVLSGTDAAGREVWRPAAIGQPQGEEHADARGRPVRLRAPLFRPEDLYEWPAVESGA